MEDREFPISAGLLLGLGLGGFFDGIILHQVLQWHHMLTSGGYPANSMYNLEVNTVWDGLFHMTTYVFVLLGLIILWKKSAPDAHWMVRQITDGDDLNGIWHFQHC